MRRVVIETPYAGDIKKNMDYLKRCLKDSIDRGETPMASHMIYTQVLCDENPKERALGISLGYHWLSTAVSQIFYIDYGFSRGMLEAFRKGQSISILQEIRYLDED